MQPQSLLSRRSLFRAAACAIGTLRFPILGANNRINVAFIGTGGRGGWLLDLALKHRAATPDIEIAAVCDVYRKRLAEAAQRAGGARTYLYHQELLQRKDIDAVFIATPDHWHAPITLAAMNSGKDVYVEKPMTHTVEEGREVAHAAVALKRVVQVGVQATSWTRWHKIRDIIQSGQIGKVVAVQGTYSRNDPAGDWNWKIDPGAGPQGKADDFLDWKQWLGAATPRAFDADRYFRFRKYWDYSGGIATDLHYHIAAPFHVALANDHPTRVAGMGGLWIYNDGREVPDTFLTAADYPGKYSMTIQSSQVNENGPVMLIRGTEGTIHLGDEWEGPQGRQRDYAQIIPEGPFAEAFQKKYGTAEVRVENVGNEGDLKHVDNFLDCVRTRQQPNCHADLGFKVMTTIDLSVRSYRNGRVYYFDSERERVYQKS
ncbi:MAG: Gfo/Idh/MocA family oxidoreductase [Bryobacteraceae bacterium]